MMQKYYHQHPECKFLSNYFQTFFIVICNSLTINQLQNVFDKNILKKHSIMFIQIHKRLIIK
jgi:hypothetical protein